MEGESEFRLFVRVSERVGQQELEEIFAKYGKVVNVQTGQAGFAFVEMASDRDCSEAIRGLDGTMLSGEKITVEKAKGATTTRERGVSASATFRCFNCNKPGHLARECKEKPRNPLYADTRGTKLSDLSNPKRSGRFHPYERPRLDERDRERERYERRPSIPQPVSSYYDSRYRAPSPHRGSDPFVHRDAPRHRDYVRGRSPEIRRSPERYRERYDERKDYRGPVENGRGREPYPRDARPIDPYPYRRSTPPRDYERPRDSGFHGHIPEREYRSQSFHPRSPARGDDLHYRSKSPSYRPRTPERFRPEEFGDRMRERLPEHRKTPERYTRTHTPPPYAPRSHSPQPFTNRNRGYENYPRGRTPERFRASTPPPHSGFSSQPGPSEKPHLQHTP